MIGGLAVIVLMFREKSWIGCLVWLVVCARVPKEIAQTTKHVEGDMDDWRISRN